MRQKRPGSVLTIAVLHLIGGGIGLIIVICAGVGLLLQGTMMKSLASANPQDLSIRLQKHLEQQLPANAALQYLGIFVELVLSVMLLAAGIGLLSMRNWARILSLVYAVFSILYKLFALGLFIFVTWPVIGAFLDAEAKAAPAGPAGTTITTQITIAKAAAIGGVIFNAALITYPIVVLFVLLNPSVRRTFSEEPGEDRDDDRYEEDRPRTRKSRRDDDDDDDDDDRWRAPPSDKYRS
jgi:hypothetical protein